MKKILISVFIAIAVIFAANNVSAVPANPNPVKFVQPDGSELMIVVKGDEKVNWIETTDGYTLMYNKERYLTYAVRSESGDMQPSNIIAKDINKRDSKTKSFLQNVDKHLFYSKDQVNMMLDIFGFAENEIMKSSEGAKAPVTGHKSLICALVGFQDKPFEKTVDEFYNIMNQVGYVDNKAKGSVRDFFFESSYGQLIVDITVAGPYTAPYDESYYWTTQSAPHKVGTLARWLLQQVDEDYDMTQFDNDDDNRIDGFHFIFAGNGQEATGAYGDIWSHKGSITPMSVDGKTISVYSCSPERYSNSKTEITTIGVICHEMTHAFGAPDYYDTNYDSGGQYDGTGNWDIMANGSYNGKPGGSCPAHHNMYQKIKFGWVEPMELTEPRSIYAMPNSAEHPVAYTISTTTPKEYFILENRQQVGFDSNVPGSGLLIYRVHSTMESAYTSGNAVNTTHPQKLYPVCASSNVAIPTSNPNSYGSINSSGCPFPGSSNNTEFTDASTPSAQSWAGENTGKPLTNIANDKDKLIVSFDFMGGISSDCAAPQNLTGEFLREENYVLLKWDAVDGANSYNVYRNDVLIKENATSLTFNDTDFEKLDYAYFVTANIGDCESKPSNIVNVHVLRDMYNIEISSNIEGAGELTGAGEYEKDTKVVLRARANDGFKFINWLDGDKVVSKSTLYQFSATRNLNLTAVFEKLNSVEDIENIGVKVFGHNGKINIIANDTNYERIVEVIDVNGRIIKNEKINSNSMSIDVNERGVYIVRIIDNAKTYSKKVVL